MTENLLISLVFVVELGHHGDGVLGLRVLNVADVQSVQWHERDLSRQLLLVHLLENLRAHLVRLDNVVEQSISGRYLDSRVNTLLAVKVLDDEAVVGVGHLGLVAPSLAERLQHPPHAVPPVEDGLAGHGAQGLVRLGQLLPDGRVRLLQVHLLAAQLVPLGLQLVLALLQLVEPLVLVVDVGAELVLLGGRRLDLLLQLAAPLGVALQVLAEALDLLRLVLDLLVERLELLLDPLVPLLLGGELRPPALLGVQLLPLLLLEGQLARALVLFLFLVG